MIKAVFGAIIFGGLASMVILPLIMLLETLPVPVSGILVGVTGMYLLTREEF